MNAPGHESTPVHAILRGLLPPPGYVTSRAVLCTYSLDLVVLAAMLAHLAGFDGDDVRVTPLTLATALTELSDRVTVIAQAGRVKAPPEIGPFHALLAGLVRVRTGSARFTSWHPKLIVVRFVPRAGGDGAPVWRLWLGSHNFVRTTSWELGGFVSTEGGRSIVPGLSDDLARFLRSCDWELDHALQNEIGRLRWDAAGTVAVQRFCLPGSPAPRWMLRPGAASAVVVSPFLDWGTLEWLAGALPTRPTLLTNRETLEGLAREASDATWGLLGRFSVLVACAPTELPSTLSAGEDPDDDEDGTERDRGLHAKALLLRFPGGRASLQFGSANATHNGVGTTVRARSEEVVCEVGIAGDLADSLLAPVLAGSIQISASELELVLAAARAGPPPPGPSLADELAAICATVRTVQQWSPEEVLVLAESAPSLPVGAHLSVATLLSNQAIAWPPGATTVALPAIPAAERSDFLLVRLERAAADPPVVTALLHAPCTPPRDAEGDATLLRRALGPDGILAWLRGRLDGVSCSREDWDQRRRGRAGGSSDEERDSPDGAGGAHIPLEVILRAWVRDHPGRAGRTGAGEFAQIESDIRRMRMAEFAQDEAGESDAERSARRSLRTFLELWSRVRRGLEPAERRR